MTARASIRSAVLGIVSTALVLGTLFPGSVVAQDLDVLEREFTPAYEAWLRLEKRVHSGNGSAQEVEEWHGLSDRLAILSEAIRKRGGDVEGLMDRVAREVAEREGGAQPGVDSGVEGSADGSRAALPTPESKRPWKVEEVAELAVVPETVLSRRNQDLVGDVFRLATSSEPVERLLRRFEGFESIERWQNYLREPYREHFFDYYRKSPESEDLFRATYGTAQRQIETGFLTAELRSLSPKELPLSSWGVLRNLPSLSAAEKSYDDLQDRLREQYLTVVPPGERSRQKSVIEEICQRLVRTEKQILWHLGTPTTSENIKAEEKALDVAGIYGQQRELEQEIFRHVLYTAFIQSVHSYTYRTGDPGGAKADEYASERLAEANRALQQSRRELDESRRALVDRVNRLLTSRFLRGLERASAMSSFRPHDTRLVVRLQDFEKSSWDFLDFAVYRTLVEEDGFFNPCDSQRSAQDLLTGPEYREWAQRTGG